MGVCFSLCGRRRDDKQPLLEGAAPNPVVDDAQSQTSSYIPPTEQCVTVLSAKAMVVPEADVPLSVSPKSAAPSLPRELIPAENDPVGSLGTQTRNGTDYGVVQPSECDTVGHSISSDVKEPLAEGVFDQGASVESGTLKTEDLTPHVVTSLLDSVVAGAISETVHVEAPAPGGTSILQQAAASNVPVECRNVAPAPSPQTQDTVMATGLEVKSPPESHLQPAVAVRPPLDNNSKPPRADEVPMTASSSEVSEDVVGTAIAQGQGAAGDKTKGGGGKKQNAAKNQRSGKHKNRKKK